jgi:hypothetical protein
VKENDSKQVRCLLLLLSDRGVERRRAGLSKTKRLMLGIWLVREFEPSMPSQEGATDTTGRKKWHSGFWKCHVQLAPRCHIRQASIVPSAADHRGNDCQNIMPLAVAITSMVLVLKAAHIRWDQRLHWTSDSSTTVCGTGIWALPVLSGLWWLGMTSADASVSFICQRPNFTPVRNFTMLSYSALTMRGCD